MTRAMIYMSSRKCKNQLHSYCRIGKVGKPAILSGFCTCTSIMCTNCECAAHFVPIRKPQCAALKLCIFKRELKLLALLHLCIFFLLLFFFFLFVNFLNFAKNLSFFFKILWFPKFFDFLNAFQTFVTFARAYSLKSFKLFFPLIFYAKIVKQTFPLITRGVFGPAA